MRNETYAEIVERNIVKNNENNIAGKTIKQVQHIIKKSVKEFKKNDKSVSKKTPDEIDSFSVAEHAEEYVKNGGSFLSVMGETTNYFHVKKLLIKVDKASGKLTEKLPLAWRIPLIRRKTYIKKLNDLVLYVANSNDSRYETDEELAQFNSVLKQNAKCAAAYNNHINECNKVLVYNEKHKNKFGRVAGAYRKQLPEFNESKFDSRVVEMVKLTHHLVSVVTKADVYTKNNHLVLSPEEITILQHGMELNKTKDSRLLNDLRTTNNVLANTWTEISHIDENFSTKNLPLVFEVPVDNVSPSSVVNFEPAYNDLIVEASDTAFIKFPDENNKYFENAVKYANLMTNNNFIAEEMPEGNVPAMGSKYHNKTKVSYVEAPSMQKIINVIFQEERANVEISKKDAKNILGVKFNKFVTNYKGKLLKKADKGIYSFSWKDRPNKKIYKSMNITSFKLAGHKYLDVVKRAIAIGDTINAIKLNNFSGEQKVVSTAVAYLEMQLEKSIAFLSNNKADWIVPYITEKINNRFIEQATTIGLTKKQILSRFNLNGVPVMADEHSTYMDIAFGKSAIDYQKIVKEFEEIKEAEMFSKVKFESKVVIESEKVDEKELELEIVSKPSIPDDEYLNKLKATEEYKAKYAEYFGKNNIAVEKIIKENAYDAFYIIKSGLMEDSEAEISEIANPQKVFEELVKKPTEYEKEEIQTFISEKDKKYIDILAKNQSLIDVLKNKEKADTVDLRRMCRTVDKTPEEIKEVVKDKQEEKQLDVATVQKSIFKEILKANRKVFNILTAKKIRKVKKGSEKLEDYISVSSNFVPFFESKPSVKFDKLKSQVAVNLEDGNNQNEIIFNAINTSDELKTFSEELGEVVYGEIKELTDSGVVLSEAKKQVIKKYKGYIYNVVYSKMTGETLYFDKYTLKEIEKPGFELTEEDKKEFSDGEKIVADLQKAYLERKAKRAKTSTIKIEKNENVKTEKGE